MPQRTYIGGYRHTRHTLLLEAGGGGGRQDGAAQAHRPQGTACIGFAPAVLVEKV